MSGRSNAAFTGIMYIARAVINCGEVWGMIAERTVALVPARALEFYMNSPGIELETPH